LNLAAAIAVASASIALAVAVYAVRLSRTPDWGIYRWLAVIALGSAAFAVGNVAATTGQPDWLVVMTARFQVAGLLVELWGWFNFADEETGLRPHPVERWVRRTLLLLAAIALVPGVAFTGAVTGHAFAPWNASYRDAVPTPLGAGLFAIGLLASAWLVGKLFLAWRRGLLPSPVQVVALYVLFLVAVNDTLAATGLLATPYLLDVGFLVPLGALFWGKGERQIREAASLRELRDRLERLIEERTSELATATRSLQQAERLAALGRLAAGVAHRFDGPAAVVRSTLDEIHAAAAEGRNPAESVETLLAARESMRRITALVGQLSDAGRVAIGPIPEKGCAVEEVLEAVLADARARFPAGVSFFHRVAPGLRARMGREDLERVVGALVDNAGRAARRGQALHVVVSAAALKMDRVAIGVTDDGCGMDEVVQARAFDPFYTTRPDGLGAGLGLTVARALVEVADGTLTLESAPGKGTEAWVILPAARAEAPAAPAAG
jgi:signal transduction histidine kinase